jgi:hypothetical protein
MRSEALAMCLTLWFVSSASANLITFEGFPANAPFSGGFEDGFFIAVNTNGWITPSSFGNPGVGASLAGPSFGFDYPTYAFSHEGPLPFQFLSLDLDNAFDVGPPPSAIVEGFLAGAPVGGDVFFASNSYQTFTPFNLAGVTIDRLEITLQDTLDSPPVMDNIHLGIVPEPSSFGLAVVAALGGAVVIVRQRRKRRAA